MAFLIALVSSLVRPVADKAFDTNTAGHSAILLIEWLSLFALLLIFVLIVVRNVCPRANHTK